MRVSIRSFLAIAVSCTVPALAQERKPARDEPAVFAPERLPALLITPPGIEGKPADDSNNAPEGAMRPILAQKLQERLQFEYRFVRRIVPMTAEQRRSVARAGQRVVVKLANDYAAIVLKRKGPRGPGEYPLPRAGHVLQEGLARALSDSVSAQAARLYRDETRKRKEHFKKAVVGSVLVELDDALTFSATQRERIERAMLTRWNDQWSDALELMENADDFSSQWLEVAVVPHLSPAQHSLWREAAEGLELLPAEMTQDAELPEDKADAELAEAGQSVTEARVQDTARRPSP